MNIALFCLLALSQVSSEPVITPPSPSEEMKVWLITKFMVDVNFNEEKIKDFEKRLDSMSERHLRVLVEYYKEQIAKREQLRQSQINFHQQELLNQVILNKQQSQAYRDHLKREYDQKILQGQMEQNLVRQHLMNLNRNYYGYGRSRW